ncbi:MAG: hypothetical protein V7707_09855 [Motiliproteus sp.]
MVRFYIKYKDISRVSGLSYGVFRLVIPSLVLFASLPVLLKMSMNFYVALSYLAAISLANLFVFKE